VLTVFVPVVALVLGLALAAGALAARALSQPIQLLSQAVHRIGEGELQKPVEGAGDDEVGALARAVEDMRLRLLQHADEQDQLNRLKDQYLFSVAHELKTPLTSLVASVQLLEESHETLDDTERGHLVSIVHRSTARLQALVDNLLDLASIRTGRLSIAMRPVSIRDAIVDAVATLRPQLDARDQRVQWAIPDPPPVVLGDARRLQQIVVNLLSNANKYGPVDDVIRVEATAEGDRVRVAVTDRGPGIPLEEHPRLFDAYFRSAAAHHAAPGVGLGLAIVKALVTAHGGEVGVTSVAGGGTTVWVTLTRVDDSAGVSAVAADAGGSALSTVDR
jgi:signal transduction histidine kinase